MRKWIFILVSVGMLTASITHAANTSNPGWLLDPVTQNWSCTSNVPDDFCKANSPEQLAFAQVFPGDVAWNNRAVFLVNEWGGTDGPGDEHIGDSAMLFTVDATYSGLRGGDVIYRGLISPDNGHHWAANTGAIHAPDGSWFTVISESHFDQPQPVPENYTYLLRDQFYNWLYPSKSPIGQFAQQGHVDLIWKNTIDTSTNPDTKNCMRAALRLIPDTSSHPVYHGFAIYGAKESSECEAGIETVFDEAVPVTINIDSETWHLTINGQNFYYNFRDEFPTCPLPGLPDCQGELDGMGNLAEVNGSVRTTRSDFHLYGGQTDVPPDCPNLTVFDSNLDQDPKPGPAQRRYRVNPNNGNKLLSHDEYFTLSISGSEGAHTEISGTGYDRPSFLNSLNSSSLASYPAGNFYYRSNADRVACRNLLTIFYWSGAGIQVMDFQP